MPAKRKRKTRSVGKDEEGTKRRNKEENEGKKVQEGQEKEGRRREGRRKKKKSNVWKE